MRTQGFLLALLVGLPCAAARGQDFGTAQSTNAPPPGLGYDSRMTLSPCKQGMWADEVGEGYRKGAWEFEATLGAGLGVKYGSTTKHNLAFSELRIGRVMTGELGKGHWYQGNVELLGEVFVGTQFNPQLRYFAGAAPVLRYNFMTGTRWVPFVDASAGVLSTAIGRPDLGGNFEFDLQGGPGIKYFFRNNAAFIFQYRYLHFSSAGIYHPNKGVNANNLLLGVSWGF
ncbi:MAG: hypothetical protein JWQ04_909 [Pedosphaera sp.]|nr:hypothetical protein [Pedosphaera sp.]